MITEAEPTTDIGRTPEPATAETPGSPLPISVVPPEALPNKPEPLGPVVPAGAWIEVLQRGKYWGWRWGSGKNRPSRYGGKFEELSAERQAAYYRNVGRRKKRKD